MRMMKWCCSNTVARRLPILLSRAPNTRRILKVITWARHRDNFLILISHRTNTMNNHQKPLRLSVPNRTKTTPTSTRMLAPFKAGDTSLANLFLHIMRKEEECRWTIPIKDIKVSQKAIPSNQMRLMIHAILQLTWSHIMMSQLCLNLFSVMTTFNQRKILRAWPRGSLPDKHHKATKIRQILRIPMSNSNVKESHNREKEVFTISRLNPSSSCRPTGRWSLTELPRHSWTRA